MLSVKEMDSQQLLHGCCSECGSNEFVTDPETGEVACNKCGLVFREQALSLEPEWRAFTPVEKATKTRVGAPTSLIQFDKGLTTSFQPYTDTSGKTLPYETRLKMLRLRRWNTRASLHSSSHRNLSLAMKELNKLSDKLHIPKSIQEEAALIYRKALSEGLVRGRSITSMIAASLYMACRLTRTPRNLKTIAKASTRKRKEIARCFRLIQQKLRLKMPIDDPMKYVSKIASKVGLEQKTQNLAIELLQKAQKENAVVGKGPVGLAAAALYIASILNIQKITQQQLADAAGVTEVTVRNRYKKLVKDLKLKEIDF